MSGLRQPSHPQPDGDIGVPKWFACYTRARHEKRVAEQLERRGIECFLPMMKRQRKWADRMKLVDWPLFPSYVFARFPRNRSEDVITVPSVVTLVRAQGRLISIPDDELDNIRRFIEAVPPSADLPQVRTFEKGEWVVVKDGPYAGVRGVVSDMRNRGRVLVGIRRIGLASEINVNVALLESIPAPLDEEDAS